MSVIGGEAQRRLSRQAQRGYDYCSQIRETINRCRQLGSEPKCVWIGADGAHAMRALWFGACGEHWDGILPKMIAGVPCREGMTGGKDYVIEYYDSLADAEKARAKSTFKAVDNPLQSTH
jgi:hypothetical protein